MSVRQSPSAEIRRRAALLLQNVQSWQYPLSGETLRLNRTRQKIFGTKLNLIQASATDIPLADDSLDMVVSVGCLHHIPDIQKAVDEIHRVLKPGGVFKGMVYYKNSFRYRVYIPIVMEMHRRWWDNPKTRAQWVNTMYDGEANPYGMVYSKAEISKLFRNFTGFKFSNQNFVGEEMIPRYGGRIPRNVWLATFGKLAGLDLYFVARAEK